MNISNSINKNFFENKKINVTFLKPLNKKEKDFLKYLFVRFKLLKHFEKTSIISDIPLNDLLQYLKYTSIQQLQKFLNNLLSKKLVYSVSSNKKLIITGTFPILSSYSIVYNEIDFLFSKELLLARKINTLFAMLRIDFLIFMGDEFSYNLYIYLISSQTENNFIEVSLRELKEILNTGNKYDRFFDFEKKVLKKSVDDINLFSDIELQYEKIKIGEFKNNRVDKIKFTLKSKTENDKLLKNIKLTDNINKILDMVKGDIKDFHTTFELIKNYIIKRNFDYVYKNTVFVKENFKDNIEQSLKKALLLDFAQASSPKKFNEIVNIKKMYSTPFLIQLDISTLLRKYELVHELQILLDTGFFNKINILKDDQILEKHFETFKVYVHYFKNKESVIIISVIKKGK
ncbi:RepB family plasmid replication initiator protein [Leptotrichia sp. OH3620_COT-345]|uniref:replication initiation protein n=1 Tax=Leptotrichia sp. OH3620_COT-345 TaxID=2491048 RepID=UPI000F651757|nr:replication initiation protein [Leptotrichia sp. OH3620_COT-345]RRD39383.1 RepB family plasmid replication initiator protein [Leptotrichia sp. OH3620_COT-345]